MSITNVEVRRASASAGVVIAIVAVVTATAAFFAFHRGDGARNNGAASSSRYVRAKVPPGIALRQNARGIETRVMRWLGPKSTILSVTVVPRRADIEKVVPSFDGSGPTIAHGGPAWVVRARGRFEPLVIAPWQRPLTSLHAGFVVFDDATGDRIAYGFHRTSGVRG